MKTINIVLLAVILLSSNMSIAAGTVLYNYGWTYDWDHMDLVAFIDPSSLPPDWASWDDVLISVNVTQVYNADRHEWVKNTPLAQLGHLKSSRKYGGSVLVHWYDQLFFPWYNPGTITNICFDPIEPRQI